MIPQFDVPVSAEMLRDGGSLAMTFTSKGDEYWLLFPRGSSEQNNRSLGYICPLVVNRTLGIEHEVTWKLAIDWLRMALRLVDSDSAKHWVRIMLDVADSEGEVSEELLEIIWN